MKKSTFLGSTLGVLLLFSVISYSQTLFQQQNPKVSQQSGQAVAQSTDAATKGDSATPDSATTAERPREVSSVAAAVAEKTESQIYTATAYSLRGRTASGAPVAQGIIAADPRVLPLGSRVRIEAGSYSGEYLVADTGGAVRGKRIDIWTPSTRDAMRFGRRAVKLTVLQLGGKPGKAAATRLRTVSTAPTTPETSKAQK
jgi:3D (Asp-Asp-Asp) domain-containing protein